jgi:hypothetical protein
MSEKSKIRLSVMLSLVGFISVLVYVIFFTQGSARDSSEEQRFCRCRQVLMACIQTWRYLV